MKNKIIDRLKYTGLFLLFFIALITVALQEDKIQLRGILIAISFILVTVTVSSFLLKKYGTADNWKKLCVANLIQYSGFIIPVIELAKVGLCRIIPDFSFHFSEELLDLLFNIPFLLLVFFSPTIILPFFFNLLCKQSLNIKTLTIMLCNSLGVMFWALWFDVTIMEFYSNHYKDVGMAAAITILNSLILIICGIVMIWQYDKNNKRYGSIF